MHPNMLFIPPNKSFLSFCCCVAVLPSMPRSSSGMSTPVRSCPPFRGTKTPSTAWRSAHQVRHSGVSVPTNGVVVFVSLMLQLCLLSPCGLARVSCWKHYKYGCHNARQRRAGTDSCWCRSRTTTHLVMCWFGHHPAHDLVYVLSACLRSFGSCRCRLRHILP